MTNIFIRIAAMGAKLAGCWRFSEELAYRRGSKAGVYYNPEKITSILKK
jgi:hypothetical protein